jgi:hypothetical protein
MLGRLNYSGFCVSPPGNWLMWGAAAYFVIALLALASSFSVPKGNVPWRLQAFADKYSEIR